MKNVDYEASMMLTHLILDVPAIRKNPGCIATFTTLAGIVWRYRLMRLRSIRDSVVDIWKIILDTPPDLRYTY